MPIMTCGICDLLSSDDIPIWISMEGIYNELYLLASHVSKAHGVPVGSLRECIETLRQDGVIRGRGGDGYVAAALPDGMEWVRFWPTLQEPFDIHLS